MMKILWIGVCLTLTSCATIFTKKSYDLKIDSSVHGKVEIKDSVYKLPATVKVKRSKEDLTIKLIADTTTTHYTIRSAPNTHFVFFNLLWFELCPIAYLVDLTNQKRFYYGKSVYLNPYDTVRIIRPSAFKGFKNYFNKEYDGNKGKINLALSIPFINSFYLKPDKDRYFGDTVPGVSVIPCHFLCVQKY
jgi:hypothetical protein